MPKVPPGAACSSVTQRSISPGTFGHPDLLYLEGDALEIEVFYTPACPYNNGNVDNNKPVAQKSKAVKTPKPTKKDNHQIKNTKEDDQSDIDTDNNKGTKAKYSTKPQNWPVEEYEAPCKIWLNTTKDMIVGKDQTKAKFCERIHKLFDEVLKEKMENINKKKDSSPSQSNTGRHWKIGSISNTRLETVGTILKLNIACGERQIQNDVRQRFCLKPTLERILNWMIAGESCIFPQNGQNRLMMRLEKEGLSQIQPKKCHRKRKNNNIQIQELINSQEDLLQISWEKQKLFDYFAENMIMRKDLSGMDQIINIHNGIPLLPYFFSQEDLKWSL
ncbi:hypothetical protein VP01_4868g2 [Puccinia sorghi]|uniref:No apical meristem-associated C-terminal domain-containing protein n=1 Tax=Puccinia sorghi TaxID=27349 RepID=A0A0L6UM99_9BASI|nr:hypothetical protein VP01_4868g2 [Puccinia sorghi]